MSVQRIYNIYIACIIGIARRPVQRGSALQVAMGCAGGQRHAALASPLQKWERSAVDVTGRTNGRRRPCACHTCGCRMGCRAVY